MLANVDGEPHSTGSRDNTECSTEHKISLSRGHFKDGSLDQMNIHGQFCTKITAAFMGIRSQNIPIVRLPAKDAFFRA